MRLSQRYAEHWAELLSMVQYLSDTGGVPSENATRLGVTAEQVTSLINFNSAFQTAYNNYIDPDTHGPKAIREMREMDDAAYTFVLPLRQAIKNGMVTLTTDDYLHLFIHEDKTTRTPAEVPTDAPTLVLVDRRAMALTFDTTMQTTEGVNRVALPRNTKVARQIAVLPQGTEPTDGDFHPMDYIGRGRFTVMFTEPEVGMNAFLKVAYENSAGRGPWSMTEKAVIV